MSDRSRTDYTRWNRAGLGRFDYSDANAATLLEDLMIALRALYARDGALPLDLRSPDYWRDRFMRAADPYWPSEALVSRMRESLVYRRLHPERPPVPETLAQRNRRLVQHYNEARGDFAYEIMRAFARAAHILLGYVGAYANEGYLRTATQWDSVEKLVRMINYQPGPPASATTLVALDIDSETHPEDHAVDIARGLAMKGKPVGGGKSLVFETTEPLKAHAALNAVRPLGWGRNPRSVDLSGTTEHVWHWSKKHKTTPGEVMVITSGRDEKAGGRREAAGVTLRSLALGATDANPEDGFARLILNGAPGAAHTEGATMRLVRADTRLWGEPETIRVGKAFSGSLDQGLVVIRVDALTGMQVGGLALLKSSGEEAPARIEKIKGLLVTVRSDLKLSGKVSLVPLVPAKKNASDPYFVAAQDMEAAYFDLGDQFRTVPLEDKAPVMTSMSMPVSGMVGSGRYAMIREGGTRVSIIMPPDGFSVGTTYLKPKRAPTLFGQVEDAMPSVTVGTVVERKEAGSTSKRIVQFSGKAPSGLEEGAWFGARERGSHQVAALAVKGVRSASDSFFIEFDRDVETPHDETEFHGPMARSLALEGFDHNPEPAVIDQVVQLERVPDAASLLVKPGRMVILENRASDPSIAVLAKVLSAGRDRPDRLRVRLEPVSQIDDWAKGDLVVHFNTVMISEGESKGSLVLGSGDGEKARQSFTLQVPGISFIPSSASETGVVPDLDVFVGPKPFAYRDFVDPDGEDTDSFSSVINEEGGLELHFRRRLPSGVNNIRVARHRVGVGARGNGVPAHHMRKPMQKHRHVHGIFQPFETTGGGDREPIEQMRTRAPARLAANGRAVSLRDYQELAGGHASVWQAVAMPAPTSGSPGRLVLTILPVNGGPLSETLKADLHTFFKSRTPPGSDMVLADYKPAPVLVEATVLVASSRFDRTELKQAAEAAVANHFKLERRAFGQTLFLAEVLAVLESIDGIEAVTIETLDFHNRTAAVADGARVSPDGLENGGAARALFAGPQQIAFLDPFKAGSVGITVKDLI